MVAPIVERRASPGVAVLSAHAPTVAPVLQAAGIPYRPLLIQEGFGLPKMRPPIMLEAAGLGVLDLAHVLCNFNAGAMDGWKAGTPLPIVAVVAPDAYAHHRLLATSPAVAAVMALPPDPLVIACYLHRFGLAWQGAHAGEKQAGASREIMWFGVPDPRLPETCPDLAKLLVTLSRANKLQDAVAAYSMSRANFFRFMGRVCDALALTRPAGAQGVERWVKTLISALEAPVS